MKGLGGAFVGFLAAAGGLVALGLWRGVTWPVVAGALVGGVGLAWLASRWRARRAILDAPFPETWRRILHERIRFYRTLDGAGRDRFERNLRRIYADYRIEAVRGVELNDELVVLALAGGAVLIQHMPGFPLPAVRDVILYPDAFDDDYDVESDATIAGMVHRQGPILFSAKSLRRGWKRDQDGHNVSIHEWAHVLDWADGFADGVPGLGADTDAWDDLIKDALLKVRKRKSRLRDYGGTNHAELFAVAVEAFYEKPAILQKSHRELYEALAEYFRYDPLDRGD